MENEPRNNRFKQKATDVQLDFVYNIQFQNVKDYLWIIIFLLNFSYCHSLMVREDVLASKLLNQNMTLLRHTDFELFYKHAWYIYHYS